MTTPSPFPGPPPDEPHGRPAAGQRALRRGRVSAPGLRYFVTCVTRDRRHGLTGCFGALLQTLLILETELHWTPFALVVMPDHLHALFRLQATPLPETMRLFKGRAAVPLRKRGLSWQRGGYHEHRLRPAEELAPFLRYMLLNPYVAGCADWDEPWAAWWCAPEIEACFLPTTRDGRPRHEWVGDEPALTEDPHA